MNIVPENPKSFNVDNIFIKKIAVSFSTSISLNGCVQWVCPALLGWRSA